MTSRQAIKNSDISVLVVDDDPDILSATVRTLKTEGYQIHSATGVQECKASITNHRPDLLLLDVVLQDGDGAELCREIKSDTASRPIYIILISGSNNSSDEQSEGLELGADGYIARPVSNRELRARVYSMVRIISAERERDQLIRKLETALSEIKQLSGLLPICSYCNKIRDDQGYWKRLEEFIECHSDAQFTHSICANCVAERYPEEPEESDD